MCERVPSLQHRVRLRPELDAQTEVTLRASEWKMLVAIGEGTSAQVVAERLGIGDFQAMRELYALVAAELVQVEDPVPVEHVLTVEPLERDPAEAAALRLAAPAMPVAEPGRHGVVAAERAGAGGGEEARDGVAEPDIAAILDDLGGDEARFGSALGSPSVEEAQLYPVVDAPLAAAHATPPDVEPPTPMDRLLAVEHAGFAPRHVPYGHDVDAGEPGWEDLAPTTRHPAVVLPDPEAGAAEESGPGSAAAFAREFSRIMSDSKRRR
jgi:hypothetical protein